MWNKNRSLALSKLSVMVFVGAVVGIAVTAPWLVDWVQRISFPASENPKAFFLLTLYPGCLVAALILYDLYRLLHNIGEGDVFIEANVAKLRRISWYCIAGAAVCALSALYYLPWLFVGLAAAFVGLIVRVVKNVIAEAIALKQENDYTI